MLDLEGRNLDPLCSMVRYSAVLLGIEDVGCCSSWCIAVNGRSMQSCVQSCEVIHVVLVCQLFTLLPKDI